MFEINVSIFIYDFCRLIFRARPGRNERIKFLDTHQNAVEELWFAFNKLILIGNSSTNEQFEYSEHTAITTIFSFKITEN